MRLKQRVDRLEASAPDAEKALTVFITSYEARDRCEAESKCATIVWPHGGNINVTRSPGETETDFRSRVAALEAKPFETACELAGAFQNHDRE